MREDDFVQRMQALLDQRLSPERDALLQAAAREDSRLAELLEAQCRLFGAIQPIRGEPAEPSEAFLASVTARSTKPSVSEPPRPSIPWRPRFLWSVSLSLLAAVTVWSVWRQPAGRDQLGQLQVAATSVTSQSAGGEHASGDAVGAESANQLLQANLDLIGQLPELSVLLSEEQLDGVDALAGGLRPLRSSLEFAIGALRDTIPIGRPRKPGEPRAQSGIPWSQPLA